MDKELLAYYKLRDKLQRVSNGIATSDTEFPFVLNPTSANHHYIPKFFIDGFLNEKGLVWCYDKVNDRIKKNAQGPKGVFFEINRNSATIDGTLFSIFEDAYKVYDDLFPVAIKILRREAIESELFNELIHHFIIFLLDLYWRNPNTDKFIDNLFALLPADSQPFKGIAPQGITKQQLRLEIEPIILEAVSKVSEGQNYYTVAFPSNSICLGDMPMIFKQQPSKTLDFGTQPLIAPITSKKLFVRNVSNRQFWDGPTILVLNAIIIHYSSRMIVCADKRILEESIKTYHKAKNDDLLDYCLIRIFGNDLVNPSE